MNHEELQQRVHAALQEEDPYLDDLLDELQAALQAGGGAQQQALLHSLRGQLLEAAYCYVDAWQDWADAAALQSGEREYVLQHARLQMRWASHIAEMEEEQDGAAQEADLADAQEEADLRDARQAAEQTRALLSRLGAQTQAANSGDETDEDAPDPGQDRLYYARIHELEQQAGQIFLQLMQQHAADYGFCLRLLDIWHDLPVWMPWLHYSLLLSARAAHLQDAELLRRHGLLLARLAQSGETGEEGQIPAGHFCDAVGAVWHAANLFEARAILQQVEIDQETLGTRATLEMALENYPQACILQQQLAAYCKSCAAQSDDEDVQDEWLEAAQQAEHEAQACSAGRAHFLHCRQRDMAEGLSQLQQMFGSGDLDGVRGGGQNIFEMGEQAQQMLSQLADSPEQPQAHDVQALQEMSEAISDSICKLIQSEEISLREVAAGAFAAPESDWFAELAPQLEAAGLRLIKRFENLNNNRALGEQGQGQLWMLEDGAALVLESLHGIKLMRILSWLGDEFILTSNLRESSLFEHGPRLHTLALESDTPLEHILALHQARVALHRAQHGAPLQAIDSVARLQQADNAMRCAANAFRLEIGVSEVEMRGMHADFYPEFSATLHSAVRSKLDQLRPTLPASALKSV
ncbi:hypothetical protein V8J88_14970 [Massilia sp. W12]|uniref:hypothetical protein n=1 Tax=Massilia sp. W12 TaxID=3126507 RepID=UPI0030CBF465